MADRTRVFTSRTARLEAEKRDFPFTAEDVLPGVFHDYREMAWNTFHRSPMPGKADESWRRTDLRPLPLETLKLPAQGSFEDLPIVPLELLQPTATERHGGEVLMLPGGVQADLDPLLQKAGVIFTDLHTAEERYPELVRRFTGQGVMPDEGKFAAMAISLAHSGLFLYIPRGLVLEEPLHSVLWGPGSALAHISHLLLCVDEGASATVVHESSSPDEAGHALSAGVTEVHVGEGASLRFVELQSWGRHVWNINHERARVVRNGQLEWIFGSLGSRLTKNFMNIDLVGEGATGRFSGFYFADGGQHLNHETQQNHLAAHTTSDLLFKGAVKGHARSVWQGMIHVARGAAKADGYQANRNLVLSPDARADSIPGLEILADDVRCTHGATVGQLEQEPLFYLRSRGIPLDEAERMLVEGFFEPILQRIPFESVRTRFQQVIQDKLS